MVYATFSVASLFANFIISKLQYKYIFILSSLGYVSYTAAGIWVCACEGSETKGTCSVPIIYFIVLLGASLCGFSASLIWVA